MEFFDRCGKKISAEQFIELYGSSYYLDQDRYVSRASQNSRYVEDEIDRLLREGIKTKTDVVHILAWKIGKILHKASDETRQFCYAADWSNAEKLQVHRFGKQFKIDPMATYITDNITKLEELAKNDPQNVLNDLKGHSIKGIGVVYLITLLYFISRGKYPIYDRFAMMAICGIMSDKKPGEIIPYKELPGKNSPGFGSIMSDHMEPFISKLNAVFGDQYQKSRDVDRALWVYGHLFNTKSEK